MSARPARLLPPLLLGLAALLGLKVPGVAGTLLTYPALGVIPGMGLAVWLAGRSPAAPRWTLGLALSPLVAAGAAALLMRAGLPLRTTAWLVAGGGLALWALHAWLPEANAAPAAGSAPERTAPGAEPAPDLRFLLPWAIGAAVLISLPWLFNPWLAIRSDGWVHAGITWDIVQHGLPPEDPRFAGLHLNYVWFFNLFLALFTGLCGRDPFPSMMVFNSVNLAVCVALGYRLALTLWRDRAAAAGGSLLLVVGLNAGAWLLWPLRLLDAATGDAGSMTVVMEQVRAAWHIGTADIIYSLQAPRAFMVLLLDKFLVGTALSYAWILMLVALWGLLLWLRDGRRPALVWVVSGAAGMLFFHGVVGLSLIPVLLGTLALAWLLSLRLPWLPSRGRLAAGALALLLGALVALPYTRSIFGGWTAEQSGIRHHYLRPSLDMLWTLLSSCAVTLWIARRPLARLARERHGEGFVLLLYLAAMTVFTLLVHLPLDNETKFVFQVFIPLALVGGAAFLPWMRGVRSRWGTAAGTLALVILFLAGPAAMLVSYALDPAGARDPALHPAPGEEALYTWIRERSEPGAVFTDRGGCDLIMVKGRRRLWVGTTAGPEKAGFPVAEMALRREVEADLYGPVADPDRDAALLARLGRPVYVLYRTRESGDAAPWRTLEGCPEHFGRAYDRDGFLLYRLRR